MRVPTEKDYNHRTKTLKDTKTGHKTTYHYCNECDNRMTAERSIEDGICGMCKNGRTRT